MSKLSCIISNLYLPPVPFWASLYAFDELIIDQNEYYLKQTYRNRCTIVGANGVQTLTVPVVNGHSLGMGYKDVKIAYDTRWQQVHWRSIVAAYKSSPFFEYYADDFVGFYETQHKYLFDYNSELFTLVLKHIDFSIAKTIVSTSEVLAYDCDLRFLAKCKQHGESGLIQPPYWQVFNQRFSFVPDLSILDLLFNMGNESYLYLEEWGRRKEI